MDFEFSEDQEQLRDSVRRFLAERAPVTPWVRDRIDEPRGDTPEVWHGLAGIGAVGLLVPEEHGGSGAGMVDAAVVLEELGRAVHPGPFRSSAIGATSLVLAGGDATDRARLLPDLATGDRTATVALLEPGARFHWDAPATVATPDATGHAVSGTKAHVLDAAAADTVLVVARDPGGGLGVFEVATDVPGVTLVPEPVVDATRRIATVHLEGAPGRRLGSDDTATRSAIATTVDRLGVAGVVDGIGAATRALELAVAYAGERHQFGRPIGAFQAVAHLCADMLRVVELGRAAAYYACWAADHADAVESHRAAVMAQAYATAELPSLGGTLVQIFGGVGFTWEHDAHLYYKRLLGHAHELAGEAEHLEELARIALAPA